MPLRTDLLHAIHPSRNSIIMPQEPNPSTLLLCASILRLRHLLIRIRAPLFSLPLHMRTSMIMPISMSTILLPPSRPRAPIIPTLVNTRIRTTLITALINALRSMINTANYITRKLAQIPIPLIPHLEYTSTPFNQLQLFLSILPHIPLI